MKKKLIDSNLKEVLNNIDFDIKAETFFSNFLDDYKIHFYFQDFFERGFSNDIKEIKTDKETASKTHYAYLSRLSFYDIFPEIIFHNNATNSFNVKEMIGSYKERKKEELFAKKFFQPLENELFNCFLDVEEQENEIISALGEREFLVLLNKIWDIDQSLPFEIMSKVFKFIPFIHKISGDIKSITYILEYIFNIKITVVEKPVLIEDKNTQEKKELFLGNNFALKASNTTYLKKYIFTFNNIKNLKHINEYFSDGKIYKIACLFLKYTIPLENEFEIDFTIPLSKREFILNDNPYTGRMNISTTLA